MPPGRGLTLPARSALAPWQAMQNPPPQLQELLAAWPEGDPDTPRSLAALAAHASELPGAALEIIARPGISTSLRFDLRPRPQGRQRPVFFLVDVVQAADEWFLSVCFYEDEIKDPEELGNAIPQGLFEETGYCFDLDGDNAGDAGLMAYLKARIDEAHASARG